MLTIVSGVLLPATFLSSVFGTSSEGATLYRRELFEPVLLLVALTMAATLLILRRKRWIQPGDPHLNLQPRFALEGDSKIRLRSAGNSLNIRTGRGPKG